MRLFLLSVITFFFATKSMAQQNVVDDLLSEKKPKREYTPYTFKSTRIINGHSIETLKRNSLDIRFSHRFGDIAVAGISGHTLAGIDNASDILISVEYGILDDLMVGVGRSKGGTSGQGLKELYNGFVKYRVLKQTTDFKIPISITVVANAVVSSQKYDPFVPNLLLKNEPASHRFSYMAEALFASKATSWLSLQLSTTFVWRNYVAYNDQNALFFLGLSARAKTSKRTAILFECFMPIGARGYRDYFPMVKGAKNAAFYPNLHIGFEIETGGHVFAINLTNSEGLVENDFLVYNTKNWAQGQFRLGFTISRILQFGKGGTFDKAKKKKKEVAQ
ncbi:MAG TPA: DUF5777 family beta-barrel protein [Chitinophagales bacterium]